MFRPIFFACTGLLLCSTGAPAHDYWLQPDRFFLGTSLHVEVHLHVGEDLKSELERPFQKDKTAGFFLFSKEAKVDLAASTKDGRKPLARVRVGAPGNYLIAMERKPHFIEIEAAKFTKYLAGEGLDGIIADRKKRGESNKAGRERYSRYLKCLIQAGDRQDDTYKRILGHRLEIVLLDNPYRLKVKDHLRVQVLFEGKPLAGVRIFAHHRAADHTGTKKTTTSKDGTASFKLDAAGVWLIRLVHMRRCPQNKEADWESFWVALTFGVG